MFFVIYKKKGNQLSNKLKDVGNLLFFHTQCTVDYNSNSPCISFFSLFFLHFHFFALHLFFFFFPTVLLLFFFFARFLFFFSHSECITLPFFFLQYFPLFFLSFYPFFWFFYPKIIFVNFIFLILSWLKISLCNFLFTRSVLLFF